MIIQSWKLQFQIRIRKFSFCFNRAMIIQSWKQQRNTHEKPDSKPASIEP